MARGGKRVGAGRKLGVPNKLNMAVKEAIVEAFNEVGGVKYLQDVAIGHPQVFCALLGKILPQPGDSEDNPLNVVGRLIWQPPESAKS